LFLINELSWRNKFVPLRFSHSLSAGRKLSLLGNASGLSAFPLLPAGVEWLPLHFTSFLILVLRIIIY
jgi:hypothetical protein